MEIVKKYTITMYSSLHNLSNSTLYFHTNFFYQKKSNLHSYSSWFWYQLNLKILNLIFKSWLIKFNIRFHTTRVQLSYYSSPAGSFASGSASTSFSFMSSISFFPFFPCAWSSVFFLTPQLHIFGGGIKYLIWWIKIYISNSIFLNLIDNCNN